MSWRALGMRTWILQRLTALYMLAYLLAAAIILLSHPAHDYASWHAHFTSPLTNIATLLFFFSLLFHAWVGVRDILIDYVHISGLRLALWALVTLALIALAIWASMILYSVVVL